MSDDDDVRSENDDDQDGAALNDYECPACGQILQAAPEIEARLIECDACGAHFVIPSAEGSTDLPGDLGPSDEEKQANAAGELNSLRMRHIIVSRRSAIRSRTYCIVGAALCLMGAVKLIMMIVTDVRAAGWHLIQTAYSVFVIAALYAAGYLTLRAAYWQRESRAPLFGEGRCVQCGYDLRGSTEKCPECGTAAPGDHAPPDFSTLSDGSQHVKNLEKL
jgi:hypothetical protein